MVNFQNNQIITTTYLAYTSNSLYLIDVKHKTIHFTAPTWMGRTWDYKWKFRNFSKMYTDIFV